MPLKININKIYSPCQFCYERGKLYSIGNESCQQCEYNIAIQILKEVLKQNDYCNCCKHVIHVKGGYTDCQLNNDGYKDCNSYTIDWNAITKEYQLDV